MPMRPSSTFFPVTALVLGALALPGCVFIDGTTPPTPAATQPAQPGPNPIIQALSANPTNLTKGQPITVTIKATDPRSQPLDYTWSTTGGTLSTTSGQLVQWQPPTAAGTYTINVLVSNGSGGSTAGSLNLIVDASGHGQLSPAILPTAETPAPVASSTSPAPAAASPTPASPAAPTPAVNGRTIFADSFEQDFVNWQPYKIRYGWLIRRNSAQDGNNTAIWGSPETFQIDKDAPTYDHSLETIETLDLTGTKRPTLRFYLNNQGIPSTVLKYTVKFGTLTFPVPVTNAEQGWTMKEIDLSKAIGEKQKLSFVTQVTAVADKAYDAPMLDNVTLYDAN
jgi:hypothetical protein